MRKREHPQDSAQSETPGMHGNSTRENRETPSTPDTKLCVGRLEKAMSQKSSMHVVGESDSREVPTKCPNKGGKPLAEDMEGRRLTKENTEQTTASWTQSWVWQAPGLREFRLAESQQILPVTGNRKPASDRTHWFQPVPCEIGRAHV